MNNDDALFPLNISQLPQTIPAGVASIADFIQDGPMGGGSSYSNFAGIDDGLYHEQYGNDVLGQGTNSGWVDNTMQSVANKFDHLTFEGMDELAINFAAEPNTLQLSSAHVMQPPSAPLVQSVGMPLQYPYPLVQPMSFAAQRAETSQSSSAPSRESVATRWQYQNQLAQPYPFETYGSALIDPHVNRNPHLATKTISVPPSKIPDTTFKFYVPGAGATQKKPKASAVNPSNSSRSRRGQGQDQAQKSRKLKAPYKDKKVETEQKTFENTIWDIAKHSFLLLVWRRGSFFLFDAVPNGVGYDEHSLDQLVIDAYHEAIRNYYADHSKKAEIIEEFQINIREESILAAWRDKLVHTALASRIVAFQVAREQVAQYFGLADLAKEGKQDETKVIAQNKLNEATADHECVKLILFKIFFEQSDSWRRACERHFGDNGFTFEVLAFIITVMRAALEEWSMDGMGGQGEISQGYNPVYEKVLAQLKCKEAGIKDLLQSWWIEKSGRPLASGGRVPSLNFSYTLRHQSTQAPAQCSTGTKPVSSSNASAGPTESTLAPASILSTGQSQPHQSD